MKPKIAKIWIKALRSGKYTQGQNALLSGDGSDAKHCCLGVLCDLYNKDCKKKKKKKLHVSKPKGDNMDRSYGGDDQFLPRKVMEWAGMSSANGACGTFESLTHHNDGASNRPSKSFKQIAKIIESHQETL